jgi:hypothetical protein
LLEESGEDGGGEEGRESKRVPQARGFGDIDSYEELIFSR